jgi:hypothetical protein
MKRSSNRHNPTKVFSIIFNALAIAVLFSGLGVVQAAYASDNGAYRRADLAIRQVYFPEHAKACETFAATYIITNMGPGYAAHVNIGFNVPDPFEVMKMQGVPANLAPGKSVTVTAIFKVVAFVPTESRRWWITTSVSSDNYSSVTFDPRSKNNSVRSRITLVGKPKLTCP